MLDMPELGADPTYNTTIGRFHHADQLKAIITPAMLKKTALEWFEVGIELRLPLAVVPGHEGIARTGRASRARRVRAGGDRHGVIRRSGAAAISDTHKAEAEWTRAAGGCGRQGRPARRISARRRARQPATDALPLKGLRIIDLTMGWAGPTATRQMGDLGADIIKVESCQYPDWFRGTDTRPPYHEERTYEKTYCSR